MKTKANKVVEEVNTKISALCSGLDKLDSAVNKFVDQYEGGRVTGPEALKTWAAIETLLKRISPKATENGDDSEDFEPRNKANRITDKEGFGAYAETYGLKATDFGKTVKIGSGTFKVFGLRLNASKNVVLIKRISTGKVFVCQASQIPGSKAKPIPRGRQRFGW